jgi:NDP-hexose-3-ketoreductase
MSVLGISVWGLGRHARRRILPALSSIDELSLVGVCSRNAETVAECAQQWNCHGWTNPDEMLSNPKVDIVYISTPIGVHSAQAIEAFKAGKHVWCEKPLTCDFEDTIKLVQLAEQGKQLLAEAFMYLHHPQFSRVLKFVNGGEAGRVHTVICRFGIPFLNEPGFRHDPKLGGGALWDVGSYTVSAVLELFPGQNAQVLFAEVCNEEKLQVDVKGRALLRFSGGATTYLEWGIGLGYKNEMDLWAEQGSFFCEKIFSKPENFKPVYRIRDKNGNESLEHGEATEQFIEMFRHFHEMIEDPEQAAKERQRILDRARVMNDIVKYV